MGTMKTNARVLTPVKVTRCPNCKLLLTSLPALIPPKSCIRALGANVWLPVVAPAFRERCEDYWGHREFDFVGSGSLDSNFTSLNRFFLGGGRWVRRPLEASVSSSLGAGSGMNKLWEESRPLEIQKNSGLFYKEREVEARIQTSTFPH